jgi:hypothetical protein
MADDWRIRIELEGEHEAHGLLGSLSNELGHEAQQLARELKDARLAVSRDGANVFVYADTADQARKAHEVVEAQIAHDGLTAQVSRVEHWLETEERWDDEPAGPTIEEDEIAHGHAPWEVRVECSSHEEANTLAESLEREGLSVVRRWSYLVVGAETREQAEELAARLHGEVEAGGALVWEVTPQNPFAVFGGLAG